MKRTKKFVSLCLALAMVVTMAIGALATSEKGTITVENPQSGQTYIAYKIFDVVYNEGKDAYSYTISETSQWFNVVATKNDDGTVDSKVGGLTFQKAYSEDTYVVTKGDGFSAASFANILKTNITDKAGIPLTTSGSKVTAGNLELGYYFVTSTTGALCNLTTTNPTVTIYDKNDVPFDKVDDKDSVEVGEIVNYTITGKVPDTTGFEEYKYQITDKMSTGLTFNEDSIRIWISDDDELVTEATEGKTVDTQLNNQYYTKIEDSTVDFNVSFNVIDMNNADPSLVGKYIFITYNATVNENAVAKIEKNHATLTYSNDPTDKTKTKTMEDEETVYSAKIVINKYAKSDTTKKLEGAQFVLMNSNKNKYYKYTPATETEKAKVEWVDAKTDATEYTTDDTGAATFKGLKDGTYYLVETKAPDGYNLLAEPVEVKINGKDNNDVPVEANLTVTKSVENNTGSLLPSTGGMGTTMLYIIGGILVVGAGVLLVTKKRMGADK